MANDGAAPFVRPASLRLPLGLTLLLGAAATLLASVFTGLAFDEEARIAAVRHAMRLVHAMADFGPTTMVSSSARTVYEGLEPFGVWPGLLSAWLTALLGAKAPDPLTVLRFGWLVITATAPAALFAIVAPVRGARQGALAAALLVATPRWTHAAALGSEPAVVTTFGLWLLALYLGTLVPPPALRRAQPGRRRRFRALVFGLVLGLGVSVSLAVLWVLPLVMLHFWAVHRRDLRHALGRGTVPAPPLLLGVIGVAPVVVALTEPGLWRGGPARVAAWLFRPLAPTVSGEPYRGAPVPGAESIPALYGPHWLLATTPILLLALAVAGAFFWGREARARREAKDRSASAAHLGVLAALGFVGLVLGPMVVPAVLDRFPPRTEAVLPLVAVLAALGADQTAIRVVGHARARYALLVVALGSLGAMAAALPTAAAAFNALARPDWPLSAQRSFRLGDGSEIGVLCKAIDALGTPRVRVFSPDVPPSYWKTLGEVRRMRVVVEPAASRGAAELHLLRGASPGALSSARYFGLTVWSLSRR